MRLLQQARREVLAELLAPHGRFDDFRFRSMLGVIDRAIGDASIRGGLKAVAAVEDSWKLGLDFGAASTPKSVLYDVSPEMLKAISAVTKDSVNDIWQEAGRAIKTVVRRSVLGVDNLTDSIRRLSKGLRDPKTFGTVETRAEMIIRTEVNRTFAMASDAQMGEAAKAMQAGGLSLKKYWLTADDSRVREAHEEAGQRYSKANAIPEDQPYIVGGEPMMYPLDPSASVGQTINCRCVSVPVVGEI